MKYQYNFRVSIKGDHLRYAHQIRCTQPELQVKIEHAVVQICARHNCEVDDVTIELVNKVPRATKLMGGK